MSRASTCAQGGTKRPLSETSKGTPLPFIKRYRSQLQVTFENKKWYTSARMTENAHMSWRGGSCSGTITRIPGHTEHEASLADGLQSDLKLAQNEHAAAADTFLVFHSDDDPTWKCLLYVSRVNEDDGKVSVSVAGVRQLLILFACITGLDPWEVPTTPGAMHEYWKDWAALFVDPNPAKTYFEPYKAEFAAVRFPTWAGGSQPEKAGAEESPGGIDGELEEEEAGPPPSKRPCIREGPPAPQDAAAPEVNDEPVDGARESGLLEPPSSSSSSSSSPPSSAQPKAPERAATTAADAESALALLSRFVAAHKDDVGEITEELRLERQASAAVRAQLMAAELLNRQLQEKLSDIARCVGVALGSS